jgi:hypothetical protein
LQIAVYKKVAIPVELLLSKSYNYKLILPFEIASCFIAYIPKPTKEKYSSKLLYKSSNSWQIERNPIPIVRSVRRMVTALEQVASLQSQTVGHVT